MGARKIIERKNPRAVIVDLRHLSESQKVDIYNKCYEEMKRPAKCYAYYEDGTVEEIVNGPNS